MSALHEIVDWPELHEPVLLVLLDGWIDAGMAAAAASAHLQETLSPRTVAVFDTEELIDYRARRPVLHIEEGVVGDITWPALELQAARDLDGRHVLLLAGAEPDVRWKSFTAEVVALSSRFGVRMMIGLGAFPAAVPHTRPVRHTASAATPELAARVGRSGATVDAPAGAVAALGKAFTAAGVPNLTVWAQVPHYAAGMPHPPASVSLLRKVAEIAGLRFDLSALEQTSDALRSRLDELVAANPEHLAMLRTLEQQYDEDPGDPLPSGDDLAAEVEQFLRGLDGT